MDPVFDTRATADVLLSLTRPAPAPAAAGAAAATAGGPTYRDMLISRFSGGANGLAAALPRGIAAGTTTAITPRAAAAPVVSQPGNGDFFLMVYPHPVLGTGDGANKPWLQELPDPVTKIAWQTVAELHP